MSDLNTWCYRNSVTRADVKAWIVLRLCLSSFILPCSQLRREDTSANEAASWHYVPLLPFLITESLISRLDHSFARSLPVKCSLCLNVMAPYLEGDDTAALYFVLLVTPESNSFRNKPTCRLEAHFPKGMDLHFVSHLRFKKDLSRVDRSTFLLLLQLLCIHCHVAETKACVAFSLSLLRLRIAGSS